MMKTLLCAIVAIAATAVVSAGQASTTSVQGPQTIWNRAKAEPLVLLPVVGTWEADYEQRGGALIQVLTMNGPAGNKTPDADAARTLFGEKSAGFVAGLTATGAFPLAVARDIRTLANGTLQVNFKLISGASEQSAGIVFGLQPDGSYIYARYNTRDGNVALSKFEKGQRTVLLQGDARESLPLNQWHTLEVTFRGAAISASVNGGRLPLRYTLAAPVEGRVGVWTQNDSVTSFKEFVVQAGHQIHR